MHACRPQQTTSKQTKEDREEGERECEEKQKKHLLPWMQDSNKRPDTAFMLDDIMHYLA